VIKQNQGKTKLSSKQQQEQHQKAILTICCQYYCIFMLQQKRMISIKNLVKAQAIVKKIKQQAILHRNKNW